MKDARPPLHKSITLARVTRAVRDDNNTGFCRACGDMADDVEPDARKYPCRQCGAHEVYGAEELLFELA